MMTLDEIEVGMKVEGKPLGGSWLPTKILGFDKYLAWVETTWPDGHVTTSLRTLDQLRKVPEL